VDVVMSTNRLSPYLDETLGSLMAQTWSSWKLTVVDDGSPDPAALAAVVGRVPRSRVVRQPHRGLPAARNTGIGSTQAPLVALLDDDDLWDPDKLEHQVRAMEANPAALAAFTAGRYVDGQGREFGDGWGAESVDSRRFVSGEVPWPRIVTLMVRRSAHELIGGFNETYSVAEDNDYILRLALQGAMVGVPVPLVSYRRHTENMSNFGSIEGRRANFRVLREQLQLHGRDPEVESLLRRNIATFRQAAAGEWALSVSDALRRRQLGRFAKELWWAATVFPSDALREVRARVMPVR
jgi:glycosyltransferase involved in cell wall biosynthesis